MPERSPWRQTILAIAVLAAVALRLLTPAGWMPNPNGSGGPVFVICTGEGPHLARGLDLPPPGPGHEAPHDHCLFAGLTLVGGPAPAALPAPGVHFTAEARSPTVRASLWAPAERHRLQFPRGPPREV